MNSPGDILTGLPAEQRIREGLVDLEKGNQSIAACLAAMARPRLVKAGLVKPLDKPAAQESELTLYSLLESHGDRAYSRYNSLLRELVSFEQALDHRLGQNKIENPQH